MSDFANSDTDRYQYAKDAGLNNENNGGDLSDTENVFIFITGKFKQSFNFVTKKGAKLIG